MQGSVEEELEQLPAWTREPDCSDSVHSGSSDQPERGLVCWWQGERTVGCLSSLPSPASLASSGGVRTALDWVLEWLRTDHANC